jgi:hypothetical protein
MQTTRTDLDVDPRPMEKKSCAFPCKHGHAEGARPKQRPPPADSLTAANSCGIKPDPCTPSFIPWLGISRTEEKGKDATNGIILFVGKKTARSAKEKSSQTATLQSPDMSLTHTRIVQFFLTDRLHVGSTFLLPSQFAGCPGAISV